MFRDSDNTPSDYYSSTILSSKKSHSVDEKLNSFGLSGGYIIQIPKTKSRLHLQTGIYYNTLEYPDDFKRTSSGWLDAIFVDTNYSYTMYKKHYFSLVIAPAFEFPVFNHFGFGLQPTVLISLEEINMTMNISFNIGNATSKPLRKKKKLKRLN